MPDCDKCKYLQLVDWSPREENQLNPEIIYTEKYCKLRKKCLRFLSDKEKFDCEFFEPQHHRPLNST